MCTPTAQQAVGLRRALATTLVDEAAITFPEWREAYGTGRLNTDVVPLAMRIMDESAIADEHYLTNRWRPKQRRAALWLLGGRCHTRRGRTPIEAAVTSNPDRSPLQGERPDLVPVEELARLKGIEHIKTVEKLA